MDTKAFIFLVLVFLSVFLLARAVFLSTVGEEARFRRRLRSRIHSLVESDGLDAASLTSLRIQRDLPPIGQLLARLPGVSQFYETAEQAGIRMPGYRILVWSLAVGALVALLVLAITAKPLYALIGGAVTVLVPIMRTSALRAARLARFEEQLPDALGIISRALRAGHPFIDSIKLVGEELPDPIASEFNKLSADLTYGVGTQTALYGMLQRVPSVSLTSLVTAVLIQRETGGNMSEILDKISNVIRGRFKLARKVRTVSAEARLSAWVLGATPFVLAGMLSLTSPDYLPVLFKDPIGQKLIITSAVLMFLGILWLRRLIRIRY